MSGNRACADTSSGADSYPAGVPETRDRTRDWRAAFDRIGGPDAVTWASFWISFAANLISHFTFREIATSDAVRLLAVTCSQLAMFVPLLILRFTLLRDPPRPRPWVAVLGFVIAPLVRTPVLVWVLVTFGALPDGELAQRTLSAFANLFLVLFITALVVSTVRAHARTLHQLLLIREDLERTRQQMLQQVGERNEETLRAVKSTLDRELAQLEDASDADALLTLERLATEVVRPMSHELAQSPPLWRTEGIDRPDLRIDWRDVVHDLTQQGPFLPFTTAAIMTTVIFIPSTVFMTSDRWQALTAASVGLFLGALLANAVLDRVLPLSTTARSLAAVTIAALITAFVPSGLTGMALGGRTGLFVTLGGVAVAGLIVMVALVHSVLEQQQRTEALLADSTVALRASVVRLHQQEWYQSKALSRALHGPMQSAATAAALRLDAAARSGADTSTVIADVRRELQREIDVLGETHTPPMDIDRLLDRLIGTWTGVCEIDVVVGDGTRDVLAKDAVLRSTVLEILTEAVSNAVRHGRASELHLSLRCDTDTTLEIDVTNNGSPASQPNEAGLGSRLLDACTLSWSLSTQPGCQAFRAVLPR